jgi:hypothetical protein
VAGVQRRTAAAAAAAVVLTPIATFSTAPAHAQVPAKAPPPEVAQALPAVRQQGSGRLRFLGLRIYDARLWVGATPVADDWTAVPFALELEYARTLKGEQIAERSLVEMRRQGDIAAATAERWLALMKQLFPDVQEGDRITGINEPGQGARIFVNGTARGERSDAEFAKWFFGIWLSPRTSEPTLREQLLGRRAP